MSLSIELPPELENRIREEAKKYGVDASEFARHLIERSLPPQAPAGQALWKTLTPEEWIREFEAWTESHRGLPRLSPEAYERSSFYEGRE